MSDIPPSILPLFIGHPSIWSCQYALRSVGQAGIGSGNTSVVDKIFYLPLTIPWPYPVKRFWWINGGSVGASVDVGIYTASGTRIISVGGITTSGATTSQFSNVATPFLLSPGMYYMAYVCHTSGAFTWGSIPNINFSRLAGILHQASTYPLPATATFAAAATDQLVPFCGVTRTPSGSPF